MDLKVLGEVDSREIIAEKSGDPAGGGVVRGIVGYPVVGASGEVVGKAKIERSRIVSSRVKDTAHCRTRADGVGNAEIVLSAVNNALSPIGGIPLVALVRTAISADDVSTWPVWQARAAAVYWRLLRAPL